MNREEKERERGLVLSVDRDNCAETAAKREYARLAEEYLRGSGSLEESEYGYRLDLLREFLENTDFAALRGACEEMLRDVEALSLTLFRDGEGKPAFRVLPPGAAGGEDAAAGRTGPDRRSGQTRGTG
ncbi:MAG: hypothetical protein H5T74_11740 [Actinobacteria bacterium]|nr:hypothetical protein [Actinomycetota bacterium]